LCAQIWLNRAIHAWNLDLGTFLLIRNSVEEEFLESSENSRPLHPTENATLAWNVLLEETAFFTSS
jgi:hypothetical protein